MIKMILLLTLVVGFQVQSEPIIVVENSEAKTDYDNGLGQECDITLFILYEYGDNYHIYDLGCQANPLTGINPWPIKEVKCYWHEKWEFEGAFIREATEQDDTCKVVIINS